MDDQFMEVSTNLEFICFDEGNIRGRDERRLHFCFLPAQMTLHFTLSLHNS